MRDSPKILQNTCSTLTTDHLYVNILGLCEEPCCPNNLDLPSALSEISPIEKQVEILI